MVSRTIMSRALRPLAAMAALLGACSAAAAEAPGIVATYDLGRPGVVLVVEVAPDGRGRLEERREGEPVTSYTLVEPGGRNIVATRRRGGSSGTEDGEWVAMDGRDTPASLDAPPAEPDPYESQERYRPVGEARIGAWTGTRYLLPLTPFTHAQIEEIVVLRDPELAPLGRMLAASSRYAWEGGAAPAAPYMIHMAELISDGAPLRLGDRWTLVSLERRPIDPARLERPARLLTREEVRDEMARSRARSPEPRPRAAR